MRFVFVASCSLSRVFAVSSLSTTLLFVCFFHGVFLSTRLFFCLFVCLPLMFNSDTSTGSCGACTGSKPSAFRAWSNRTPVEPSASFRRSEPSSELRLASVVEPSHPRASVVARKLGNPLGNPLGNLPGNLDNLDIRKTFFLTFRFTVFPFSFQVPSTVKTESF